MSKLVIIPNNKDIIKTINDDLLLGINGYSVNVLNIELKDLELLVQDNKGLFIALNKNFTNDELIPLEQLLRKLETYHIKGIFYYDVAVLNIVMKNKLKLNLIWSAEHLTTNYHTINYWHEHGTYGTFLSNEITKKEIEEISEKTNSKLFVQLFGYIPMYVSRRHAIKNYLKYFGLKREDKEYYLFKEDKTYSIVDNNEGTMIFSNFILNGLKESIALSKSIDYILINGYHLKDDELSKVINYFKIANLDNINSLESELEQIFTNLGKGFLYEETIYKVKKDA